MRFQKVYTPHHIEILHLRNEAILRSVKFEQVRELNTISLLNYRNVFEEKIRAIINEHCFSICWITPSRWHEGIGVPL